MVRELHHTLWIALCSTVALVAVDMVFFPFSYAFEFVDLIDLIRLILLAVCVAVFCAPLLAVSVMLFRRATQNRWTARVSSGHLVVLFTAAMTLFLLSVVNQSSGKIFALAPWWHTASALGIGAVYYVVFRGLSKRFSINLIPVALFSILIGATFALTYLPLFVEGGFGLTGHSQTVMRTLVTAAIVVASCGIPIVYIVWDALWQKLPSVVLGVLAAIVVFVLHVVNVTLYVDNYPEIHSWLGLFSIGIVVDLFSRILADRDAPKRIFIAAAVLFHVGLFGIVMSRGTNPGYVGAVHTGWVRYGIDSFYHDLGNAPRNVANFYTKNRYRIEKRLGKKRPVQTQGTLPDTFQPVKAQPSVGGVVWILLDMKKPEEFSKLTTPETGRCFENGKHFDRAYTIAPKTNVAYPALYTSTYPATRHENQNTQTADPFWYSYNDNYNAGSLFKNAGFRTAVVTNDWYDGAFFSNKSEQTYFSGFDQIVTETGTGSHTEKLLNAFEENKNVIPVTGKYFTAFHVFEHWPEQLDEVDRFIGSVCKELRRKNRMRDTLIVLAADHGVQRREHGRTHYGMTLFEEEVRIPLKVYVPRGRYERFDHNVSLLDILPTSISLAGIETDATFEGRSLFDTEDRALFLETRLLSFPSSAIVRGDKKLIRWRRSGFEALFHLEHDPGETMNVIETDPDTDALRAQLDRFLQARNEMVWP